ncbi:MAG: hypothetical protein JNM11_14040 [Chitinimonas sp.]|nr:hypothetical protein [Chitinimonas sp.]
MVDDLPSAAALALAAMGKRLLVHSGEIDLENRPGIYPGHERGSKPRCQDFNDNTYHS